MSLPHWSVCGQGGLTRAYFIPLVHALKVMEALLGGGILCVGVATALFFKSGSLVSFWRFW